MVPEFVSPGCSSCSLSPARIERPPWCRHRIGSKRCRSVACLGCRGFVRMPPFKRQATSATTESHGFLLHGEPAVRTRPASLAADRRRPAAASEWFENRCMTRQSTSSAAPYREGVVLQLAAVGFREVLVGDDMTQARSPRPGRRRLEHRAQHRDVPSHGKLVMSGARSRFRQAGDAKLCPLPSRSWSRPCGW